MSIVTNLLVIYAAILFINSIITAILWIKTKSELYRSVFFLWLSSILSFFIQGLLVQNNLLIVLGFSSAWLINISLVYILSSITHINIPWKKFIILILASLPLSILIYLLNLQFFFIALPVALAVAFPGIYGSIKIFSLKWNTVSISEKALTVIICVLALHNIDFALLRDINSFTPYGFAIALIIIFCLSIFAPAVVLEELTRKQSALKEADQLKTNFFSNISHELRTPLTLIHTPLEGILSGSLEPSKFHFETMLKNTNILLGLISNLLDFSRIEAGRLNLNKTVKNISVNICELAAVISSTAQLKQINLQNNIEPDIYAVIDSDFFNRACYNLLSNALKFTPPDGEVSITLNKDKGWINLAVRDTGIGIPEEMQDKIFERFTQVDDSTNRHHEGTGIGLAFAKEIIEMHEGTISVKSMPKEGTTFIISIPAYKGNIENPELLNDNIDPSENYKHETVKYNTETEINADKEKVSPEDSQLILVAEDNDDLRKLLLNILSEKYTAVEAANGREALSIIENPDTIPDLIVTDIMMPEMDGFEMVRRIFSNPDYHGIPVLFLTARLEVESRIKGLELGAVDYIVKPFHAGELMARIKSQLQMKQMRDTLRQSNKLLYEKLQHMLSANKKQNKINTDENFTDKKITNEQRDKIDIVVKFLHENYIYPVTREETAAACGMSPDYLSRIFTLVMDSNFQDYLNNLRLDHAVRKIETTNDSIISVAYNSGFNNLRTFNRRFKKRFNLTPAEYRQNSNK